MLAPFNSFHIQSLINSTSNASTQLAFSFWAHCTSVDWGSQLPVMINSTAIATQTSCTYVATAIVDREKLCSLASKTMSHVRGTSIFSNKTSVYYFAWCVLQRHRPYHVCKIPSWICTHTTCTLMTIVIRVKLCFLLSTLLLEGRLNFLTKTNKKSAATHSQNETVKCTTLDSKLCVGKCYIKDKSH